MKIFVFISVKNFFTFTRLQCTHGKKTTTSSAGTKNTKFSGYECREQQSQKNHTCEWNGNFLALNQNFPIRKNMCDSCDISHLTSRCWPPPPSPSLVYYFWDEYAQRLMLVVVHKTILRFPVCCFRFEFSSYGEQSCKAVQTIWKLAFWMAGAELTCCVTDFGFRSHSLSRLVLKMAFISQNIRIGRRFESSLIPNLTSHSNTHTHT